MKCPKYKRYPLYMLWIGYMYTTNLVYHFESQLPQSASGTRTFTVPPTVPCGNFSLGSLWQVFEWLCFEIIFHSFSFFNNLVTSVTISVDERSTATVSYLTSRNTGPKPLLVTFRVSTWISSTRSSVGLFCSSPCFPETTFLNSSLVNMSSIAFQEGLMFSIWI